MKTYGAFRGNKIKDKKQVVSSRKHLINYPKKSVLIT